MKQVFIFMGGFVTGAGLMYILLKNQFEEDLQTEVNEVRRAYGEAIDRMFEGKKEDTQGVEEEVDPTIEKSSIDNEQYKNKVNYYGYDKISVGESEDSSDVDPEAEFPQDDEPEEDTSDKPYVISAGQFAREYPQFNKVTLEYYEYNGILVSENNDSIENIAETIGADSLKRIGEYEPDVVYVRNERLETDYEVCRIHSDFYPSSSEGE